MKMLQDKVAIVTASAAGIGRASSLLFAGAGARVAVVDLDAEGNQKLVDEISNSGGTAHAFVADVSCSQDVRRTIQQVLNEFGRVDILFNNVGWVPSGKLHETPEEDWDRAMAVNIKSMYLFACQVIPLFLKQGAGVILNTASAAAQRTVPDRALYTVTKSAVCGLTRALAFDYAKDGIRVNCLCPGTIDTPSLRQRLQSFEDVEAARKRFEARQPMGRLGTAEEVAEAALFLVSDASRYITGAALTVDGGFAL